MSKADVIFKKNARQILEHGTSTEGQAVRPHWPDGTPAHTIKQFGAADMYDLQEEFPAITVRKTGLKSAWDEILWIYQRKSNKTEDLRSSIWNSWSKASREERGLVYVEPRQKVANPSLFEPIIINPIIPHDVSEEKMSYSYGPYFIIERAGKSRYRIQFVNTGNIKEVSAEACRTGRIFDEYSKSTYGIGYYGNCRKPELKEYFGQYMPRWIDIWRHIMKRCNPSINKAVCYDGVTVSSYFQSCENFLTWVKANNPFDKEALATLEVDKDYYGSKCYSENTCILLTREENNALTLKHWYKCCGKLFFSVNEIATYFAKKGFMDCISLYRDNGKPYSLKKFFVKYVKEAVSEGFIEIIDPQSQTEKGFPRFDPVVKHTIGKAYGYQIGSISKFRKINMSNKKKEEEKVKFLPSAGFIPEYKDDVKTGSCWLVMDQMDAVLYQLKYEPFSRRILTTTWNVEELTEMGLQPCVWNCTFSVTDEKRPDGKLTLNLTLNQRSNDLLAANNWNIAQYAVFLMAVAQVSGMVPGKILHVITDQHIYDRHVDIVKELIERPEYPAPKVWLDPEVTDFYQFTYDSLHVENYQAGEQVSFEVAI